MAWHTRDWKMIVVSTPLVIIAVVVVGWAAYGIFHFCMKMFAH
jgi:hypothetical protein